MPSLFRKTGGFDDPTPDEIREKKLDAVKQIAERFTYDLGLLIAGHPVELEQYVDPGVAGRMRASVEPFLASGDAMRPNFGDYGELRIEGYLLSGEHPIHAYVEFDDQSIRETSNGDLIPAGRRRMLLSLVIDPSAARILDYKLGPATN
jgi:hypothetical protein